MTSTLSGTSGPTPPVVGVSSLDCGIATAKAVAMRAMRARRKLKLSMVAVLVVGCGGRFPV